jgi:membrane-associated phospholipid phosphatase
MHIISTTVMMLLAWKVDKRLGVAFTLFTAFIIVGSLRLGWHYLADDIAGMFLAAIFWIVSGRIARAWEEYLARRQCRDVRSIGAVAASEA